jgi:hypothetical protein
MKKLNRLRLSPSCQAALTELLGAELRPIGHRSKVPRITALIIVAVLLAVLLAFLLNR